MPKKKKEEITIRSSAAEYLTYVASVGDSKDSFEMRYEDENIWLTQKMMATLYDVDVRTVNEHIKKIYADGELTEEATIRKFRIVQTEGLRQVNREVIHYNLQMIIAVGFKVNNDRAVRFRKWSGQIVKDYTIQGWTMDKERLKKGHMFTDEYFERQLQNIREIRLSERKFYQKITDLYATAFDYDKDSKTTRRFFQTVQNKMHWAVHRHTAAELIVERADAEKEYMGIARAAVVPGAPAFSRPMHSRISAMLSPTIGVGASERSTIPNGIFSRRLASIATSCPRRVTLKAVFLIVSQRVVKSASLISSRADLITPGPLTPTLITVSPSVTPWKAPAMNGLSSGALQKTTSLEQPNESRSFVASAIFLITFPISATASMLIPVFVEARLTEEHIRSVEDKASGSDRIRSFSAFVMPFEGRAE